MDEVTLDIEDFDDRDGSVIKIVIDGKSDMERWHHDLEVAAVKVLLQGILRENYSEHGKSNEDYYRELNEIQVMLDELKRK
ncbi:hypothetical protein [Terribacillus saccharophilus]|uniref:Uncharacterized protein n=1 Tax=Terribacillus saccharophilus TaxID=361277 RepID=A0ABX4H0Y8_9BACI|nr:hypothetical protein [Terribacillus saccharophilus]PAD36339.1 hypothetical protein CHH56_04930 [Terribacillus saccharophilus]PAD95019.1 hypothetical protein CHH50_15555 [Terribacillus saccharophilus]PAE00758.1 hypothetical protein CHH48_05635 [Terribacillus saccharophilus]